jgi:hypothetical protein
MGSILSLLLSAAGLLGKFLGVRQAQVKAGSDQTHDQAQVQVAEAGLTPVDAIMRAMIAFGPVVYLNKIFIIDKVLGWGTTDALSPELSWVLGAVVCFYLLTHR